MGAKVRLCAMKLNNNWAKSSGIPTQTTRLADNDLDTELSALLHQNGKISTCLYLYSNSF